MPARCPICQADNPPGSHFCHLCGTALPPNASADAPADVLASPPPPDTLPRRTAGPEARLTDIGTDLRVLTVDVASYSGPRIKGASRSAWRLSVAAASRSWQWMAHFGAAAVARLKSLVGGLKPYRPGASASVPPASYSVSAAPHQPDAELLDVELLDADLQPAEPSAAAAISCPRCHRISEPGSLFCFSCGLPLDDATPDPAAFPMPGAGPPAGFWQRFAAWLIDLLILGIVDVGIIAVGPGFDDYFAVGADWHWVDLIGFLLGVIYYTVGVSVWATTVGKRLLGLRVLRPDGRKAGVGRAIARYFAAWLSLLIFGVGFLMIALRSDKRGLHDLICDTVVTRQ